MRPIETPGNSLIACEGLVKPTFKSLLEYRKVPCKLLRVESNFCSFVCSQAPLTASIFSKTQHQHASEGTRSLRTQAGHLFLDSAQHTMQSSEPGKSSNQSVNESVSQLVRPYISMSVLTSVRQSVKQEAKKYAIAELGRQKRKHASRYHKFKTKITSKLHTTKLTAHKYQF